MTEFFTALDKDQEKGSFNGYFPKWVLIRITLLWDKLSFDHPQFSSLSTAMKCLNQIIS